MNTVTIKRVFKTGYANFRRNGWLSTATILVMTLALFVLGWLMLLSVVANSVLSSVEDKIDISVYFKNQTDENQILPIKDELAKLPSVARVDYVSADEALKAFRERHKNNNLITESLNELDGNPLSSSLNIKAKNSQEYAAIAEFLSAQKYPAVDKINYFENQKVIDRLSAIVSTIRTTGAILVLVLAFIAVLVALNTIRLAIFTMREEISIMRLVGATSWFIRWPFLFEGMLYGALAALVTTAIFVPALGLIAPSLNFVLSVNLFTYFMSNLWEFLAILLLVGIMLGVLSSFIAMRRYLKI